MTPKKVQIDADVAGWLRDMLFPADPQPGQMGVQVSGTPGTEEFDNAVDLYNRAKTQLGG